MLKVRLASVLQERGISQRELARRTKKHPDVISRFAREDTGAVSYELLDRICSVLNCDVSDLLEYVPDDEQMILFEAAKDLYDLSRLSTSRLVAEQPATYRRENGQQPEEGA